MAPSLQRLAGSRVITLRGGERFGSLQQLHAYTAKRNLKLKVFDFVKFCDPLPPGREAA